MCAEQIVILAEQMSNKLPLLLLPLLVQLILIPLENRKITQKRRDEMIIKRWPKLATTLLVSSISLFLFLPLPTRFGHFLPGKLRIASAQIEKSKP